VLVVTSVESSVLVRGAANAKPLENSSSELPTTAPLLPSGTLIRIPSTSSNSEIVSSVVSVMSLVVSVMSLVVSVMSLVVSIMSLVVSVMLLVVLLCRL